MTRFLVLAVIGCFISFSSNAADNDGKFAAKGAARKKCSDFLLARQNESSQVLLYGGWIEGYITGFNQFQPNNYDIVPWQTTELLLAFMQRHCSTDQEAKFFDALSSLIKSLFPIRLTQESRIIEVTASNSTSYYYEEIIARAKKRLHFLGYYEEEPTLSGYTDGDAKVFAQYQTKLGLEPTGLPDQYTLTNLFLKPNPQSNSD